MYLVKLVFCFVTSLLLIAKNVNSARILAYFPTPSISHQVVFRPLTLELARRGHDVTVITTDPIYETGHSPANYTEIDVHDMSYKHWKENMFKHFKGDPDNHMTAIKEIVRVGYEVIYKQLQTESLRNIIENGSKYDLLIIEAWPRPAYILSHLIKAPLILFSSLNVIYPVKNIIGAPSHPLMPLLIQRKLYNLTFHEKVSSIYDDFTLRLYLHKYEYLENQALKEIFGEKTPPIGEICNNVDMTLININPIWEGNYPYPPNVVLLGGLHQKQEKVLPDDLKSFLDSSKHGVIYMSFGTNVSPSLLPAEKIQTFNKVFAKLPYDVLWKWDTDIMTGKADNVKIFKWLPQSDLLRHPKIKLFITQGGLQSTDESITAGVPLIAFPMLGDQWYNAEKYVYHKIGLKMDIESLSEEILETSIKKVIEDKSYRENIVRLRTLMNDQPQTPLERAVWWTEYVIRNNGAKHLRSPMANISWAEYLVLDVVLFVLGVSLIALIIGVYFLYKLLKFVKSLMMQSSKLKEN